MAATLVGLADWSCTRDRDGYKDFQAVWKIKTSDPEDGPGTVLACPGLPAIGSPWSFGNDTEPWVFCRPDATVRKLLQNDEKTHWWRVEQVFSNRPLRRCQTSSIENPLDEPPDISGSFVKYVREAAFDKDGKPFKNSAHERLRGKFLERDYNRHTISISMNILTLPLSLYAPMVDTVNDAPLWGLSPRMVKLSNVIWSRKLYGTCTYYYTVTYEFDIDFQTFDRLVPDEGTKVLAPGGDPDNPADFIAYKDKLAENSRVFLNGAGEPVKPGDPPANILIQHYTESNFLALGIPPSL